jgi:ribosomal protein S20
MPVTVSAIKALRQDQKRARVNRPIKSLAQKAVGAARKNPTQETVRLAYSALDKAVKKHVFKKRTADRLKGRLAALLAKGVSVSPAKPEKKTRKPKKKTAPAKASPTKKPAKK